MRVAADMVRVIAEFRCSLARGRTDQDIDIAHRAGDLGNEARALTLRVDVVGGGW